QESPTPSRMLNATPRDGSISYCAGSSALGATNSAVSFPGPMMRRQLLPLVLAATSLAAQQPDQLKGLRWRSVGPANNAGRVSVVAGVPGNRDVYYVAGANGGIIKTTNGGVTFRPIFDKQPMMSIGAIAIAPSDPNIIYVGTGEENPRNNASIGDG